MNSARKVNEVLASKTVSIDAQLEEIGKLIQAQQAAQQKIMDFANAISSSKKDGGTLQTELLKLVAEWKTAMANVNASAKQLAAIRNGTQSDEAAKLKVGLAVKFVTDKEMPQKMIAIIANANLEIKKRAPANVTLSTNPNSLTARSGVNAKLVSEKSQTAKTEVASAQIASP